MELDVTVTKVLSINPHPNADKLELAMVFGYPCVVQIGKLSVGDLVYYIPPDAVLPDAFITRHNLEFVRKDGRTKSIKLRGYLSQGIILPIDENVDIEVDWKNIKEGDNIAEQLGITKYEPKDTRKNVSTSERSSGKKTKRARNNSKFIKYTSINNIKRYMDVFDDDDEVIVTEKIHGTNFRFGWLTPDKLTFWQRVTQWWTKETLYDFCIGSHNVQLSLSHRDPSYYDINIYAKIAKKYKDSIPKGYIFFGEIYGEGIQDLTYAVGPEHKVRIFDIYDPVEKKYLDNTKTILMSLDSKLLTVPPVDAGKWKDVKDMALDPKGASTLDPNTLLEGYVIKTTEEETSPICGRKILKSINEEYLLRKQGTEFK